MIFTFEREREDDGRWLAEVPPSPECSAAAPTDGEAVAKVPGSHRIRACPD